MLSEPHLTDNIDCSNCQRLVDSTKVKLTDCSNERKIQILTLAPEDWIIHVSEHVVKQARKLKKEKWILATPSNYYREGLDKETKKCTVEFYERDDVSCTCPGKKDCVSIRNKYGSKERVQKRLLLANISEIYASFKAESPSLKI